MIIAGTPIVAVQYSAILDSVTCDLCDFYDSMTWDINDSAIPNIPIHTDCRCIFAYIAGDEIPENWLPDAKKPSKSLIDDFSQFAKVLPGSIAKYAKSPEGRKILDVSEIEEII